MNYFLLFIRSQENRRILHCFPCRYEFCMQKYPIKCIFIEFPYKAQFQLILSKAIAWWFKRFSQKLENVEFCFICLLFDLKLIFYDFLWQCAQEFQWQSQTINKNEWFSIIFAFSWKPYDFALFLYRFY